ncbi:unnamed protein product, partial [Sphacelaria rigidula]
NSANRFLRSLGPERIRDLLRLRRTAGSLSGTPPPSRVTLLTSLNIPHSLLPRKPSIIRSVRVKLAVGGRTLCKHSQQGREGRWGSDGGTEADKSARAGTRVLEILQTTTWVNLHAVGGGWNDGVFEVRELNGYGARWSVDGTAFRGFLEPHMEDRHAKGWKH